MKTRIMIWLLLASALVFNQNLHAQTMVLRFQGGLPRHYEAYKDYFEDGVLWGAGISASLGSNLELGLDISRSTWNVVDGNELEELSFSRRYTPLGWESRGHGAITEVCVSLRIVSRPVLRKKVGFFAQVGIGYYWTDLNALYENPSMCLNPNYDDPSCAPYQASYDRNNPGIKIGAGAAIPILGRLTADIQPSARIVFAEKDRITYGSIDLSMRYRIDR